ncbi:MAG TPA: GGDEF domain-containing protein [Candidatus Acidoferrum sp.]|nr:GGDEF domain-containing protein [Candidatus Acidoferrum sp.]
MAVLLVQAIAGGRAIYATLWLAIGSLVVVGGWLFGRQEDRLRRISATDSLTGLTNRGELERRLEQERARAVRHGQPLSLLLIDVDLLKEINDGGGHRAGDRALLAVADALRGSCRSVDIAARVGGDEFAILAPSTSARDAVQLAARVQAGLRAGSPAAPFPVTVSIGIADLESADAIDAGQGGFDLLEAADRALYRAKTAGRDRVAVHGADRSTPSSARVSPRPLRVLPGGAR